MKRLLTITALCISCVSQGQTITADSVLRVTNAKAKYIDIKGEKFEIMTLLRPVNKDKRQDSVLRALAISLFTLATTAADAQVLLGVNNSKEGTPQQPVVHFNMPQSYTASCPAGYTGSSVTITKVAGAYSSTQSVADANAKALSAAMNEAQAALKCTQIPPATDLSNMPAITLSTPGVPAPGGSAFTYTGAANISNSAPTIGEFTRTANNNEHIIIAGDNLSGSTYKVYDGTKLMDAETVDAGAQTAVVRLPYELEPNSTYLLIPTKSGALGRPQIVNKAESWWMQDEAAPGMIVSYYGANLKLQGSNPSIYIRRGNTGQYCEIVDANPHRIRFKMPNMTAGNVEVWAHNGSGGELGWAAPLTLNVTAAQGHILTRSFGTVYAAKAFSDEGINAAVMAAGSNGNKVYLPAGTYNVNAPLLLFSNTEWYGDTASDGTPLSIINVTASFNNVGEGLFDRTNGQPLQFVRMRGIKINGNGYTTGAVNSLIDLGTPQHIQLENVWIDATSNSGGVGCIRYGSSKHIYHTRFRYTGGLYASSGAGRYGEILFLDGVRQNFLEGGRFYYAWDAEAAISSKGARELSMSNCSAQDLDNSTWDGRGWGKGRFFAAAGAGGGQYGIYFGENVGNSLGVRSGQSTLSLNTSVSTGSKTFTTGKDLMVQPGYGVVIYTGPNRMIGTVTAYNKNTGVMSVNITSTEGSGTWSNWIVDVQIPAKPDYNKGEIFLWEGSAERFSGMAAGATSGSIILNNNVSAPGGNGINYVAILKGKGAGQYRRITGGWGSNVLQISEPWNILPDATSLVAIGPFNEKLALYKNELNADGKRYISENTNAAGFASTGVSLYGGCFNTYVSDNAMRGLRSAFISFSMQYTANGVSNPNLFNNFLRNDAIDCGWGMQVRSFHEWSDWSGGTMTAPGIIANIFRANRVVNSKHADASYYLPRSAYAGHPAVDGIVWEKNITTKGSLIGNTIKNWSRNEFGQAPVADKTAGTVAREIYYSNGSAN